LQLAVTGGLFADLLAEQANVLLNGDFAILCPRKAARVKVLGDEIHVIGTLFQHAF